FWDNLFFGSPLDPGERAVIALAEEQGADLVIVDDGLGRRAARTRQLKVTGLLGILDAAAQQSLVDFQSRFLVYNKQHLEFRDRCLRHCCNSINETIRGQLTEITKQVYLPTHKFSL
ncbi:MAG: hypothetical protein H0X31_21990, partial [Nostocaceae cyanobacterium]|nr:hypothetical protein [Nostocaceae cyanobacterium]